MVQTKLTIGQPGDKYEREADRVAEAVMGMHGPSARNQEDIAPGRQVRDPHTAPRQRRETRDVTVRATVASSSQPLVPLEPELQVAALRGGGRPLSDRTLVYMQTRFGHNFERVRVHTDRTARGVADTLKARAFTIGQDIAFAAGQYSPESTEGRRLLAHELAHVVQHLNSPTLRRKENDDKEKNNTYGEVYAKLTTRWWHIFFGDRDIDGAAEILKSLNEEDLLKTIMLLYSDKESREGLEQLRRWLLRRLDDEEMNNLGSEITGAIWYIEDALKYKSELSKEGQLVWSQIETLLADRAKTVLFLNALLFMNSPVPIIPLPPPSITESFASVSTSAIKMQILKMHEVSYQQDNRTETEFWARMLMILFGKEI